MLKKILFRRLGLSDEAGSIYLTLLELPQAHVADLQKKLKLHATHVQGGLEELMARGCVSSFLRGKRRFYVAEHPDQLQSLVKQSEDELQELLPELRERFAHRASRPMIRFYSGAQGIKSVYEDLLRTLKKGEVFFRYESPEDYKKQDKYLPRAYWERVCEKREIEKFVITNEITASKKPKQLERVVRVVPTSFDPFQFDLTEIIYANKVAFIDFVNETAWIIENERFALFQKKLFKLLFEKL